MGQEQKDRVRCKVQSGFLLLLLLLCFLSFLNLFVGSVHISAGELTGALLRREGSEASQILWALRMPRLLAAVFLGGGLAVSGFLLQTFFANPIAGPYVLGISSGAKLMVAFVMVFSLSRGTAPGSVTLVSAAFLGAMLSISFILAVAGRVRNMSLLVICGVMIGYLCSAASALPAYLLTGVFHCIVLWAQGHAAWSSGMSVTLRELCASLLWSLPMTWLFLRVFRRVHADD